jgi:hypothetical protein
VQSILLFQNHFHPVEEERMALKLGFSGLANVIGRDTVIEKCLEGRTRVDLNDSCLLKRQLELSDK